MPDANRRGGEESRITVVSEDRLAIKEGKGEAFFVQHGLVVSREREANAREGGGELDVP